MKKVNIILFIVVIVVAILIGIFVYKTNNKIKDDLVEIDGVSFTLNNVKAEFLKYDEVKKNKCKVSIIKNKFNIECKNGSYEYQFINGELDTVTDENGFWIFKYLVDSIQVLHGAESYDYIETIDKFLNNEILVKNIMYNKIDGKDYLGINTLVKLEKYQIPEVIEDGEIKSISKTNLEYKNSDNELTGIFIRKSNDKNSFDFSSKYVGSNYEEKVLNIKLYDDEFNLLEEKDVNLGEHISNSENYLNFSFDVVMKENYSNVKNFSISIK